MAQRTITGPILDSAGAGLSAGTVRLTPLEPAGTAADGLVLQAREYPISGGAFNAVVVVPGLYRIDVLDAAGESLRSFSATIAADSLADITLKQVWDSRLDPLDIPSPAMREGDSILRLAPGGGAEGDALLRSGGRLTWGLPQSAGGMQSDVYDPQGRYTDAFDRSSHTGTQPISSVSGLQSALDGAWLRGYTEYAIIAERKPAGQHGGSPTVDVDYVRPLNTVLLNNSGLTNAQLLNVGTSSVTLRPGRVYYGWAYGQFADIGKAYVKIKSTDGAIDIIGPAQRYDDSGSGSVLQVTCRVDFRIERSVDAGDIAVQLLQRVNTSRSVATLGYSSAFGGVTYEEYASITIFSRPL